VARLDKSGFRKDRNGKQYECILCLCQVESDYREVRKSQISFVAVELPYNNGI